MHPLDQDSEAAARWFAHPRFTGIERLYSPRQVAEQRGTIDMHYPVAATAAEGFYARLRALFDARQAITTFGPYSPGQAVVIKRLGIEGIYLGGWATSAKGSLAEDPGADLASYPLGQVPDEAASIVRALLTADKNQRFARSRMTADQRAATPEVDYRPFIIADADTGHGGEAHVRNLIRRFVEVGVPGYHIEDQKPGVKKCGHQGGKVLVSSSEQIQRLNAARLQLDTMRVAGVIVARTDAEAATLLDGSSDERDHPFILGATNLALPSYRTATVAIHRRLFERGMDEIRGHLMFALDDEDYTFACAWLETQGLLTVIDAAAQTYAPAGAAVETMLDGVMTRFLEAWQREAGLSTYGQAVADAMRVRVSQGEPTPLDVDAWLAFAQTASMAAARHRAASIGINITWDRELAKTPEGYYQVRGGLEFAIAKSLAAAPFADILWMETNSADLDEARAFALAIHARFPDKMLAYNLSPSFNWDTTGMSDEQMAAFPAALAALGFVFNFITYGGHQIDGLAAEEFATALLQDGMLSLARLQRKLRLLESPYRTPQTLAGGPRLDAALMAASGRTATTKAMGAGSTQHQHLVQTEVPPRLLRDWLEDWVEHHAPDRRVPIVELRPLTAGSDLLELRLLDAERQRLANVVFTDMQDRRGRTILTVRDQNTFDPSLRHRRLMTLAHLFLIHRHKAGAVHYVSPTDDNRLQTQKMQELGIFSSVTIEAGHIIVATVNSARIAELVAADRVALRRLIERV